jgi:selenocysteine lyase/cysteine desulfurase
MATRDLYLNHAGTSWPKPRVVSEAVRAAMTASPAEWPQRFDEAHEAVADFFGVSQREQILLTPGCTSALAVGLGDVSIADGKRVLTSRWEHHALHRPLLKLASTGVRLEYIPPAMSEPARGHVAPIDLDWFERALSRNDVALVAITAACNVTGELLPYEDVIRISHQYGAMVLIDAAQIVGWVRLDLPRLGADLVAFGGHKGLQAPWGIGGLYLSDRIQMKCTSATCELPIAGEGAGKPSLRPGYCDVGSVDQFALAGLHAAIKMLRQQNMPTRLSNARKQIQRIREMIDQVDRLSVFGPTEPDQGMPSLAIAVSGVTSNEVASQWKRHGIVVGSGIHCAPVAHETLGTQDSGLVRLSVGLGQPNEEIDEAIERLRSALKHE